MKPLLFYRIKDIITKTGASWDKLALNENNANEYAEKHINKEPERFLQDKPTHYSMEYCLAHSGESINERFRNNSPEKIDLQIAEVVDTHRTDTDLIVYRGICDHVYDLMIANAKNTDNADFLEKGFTATSLVKGHELNYKKKLRIFIPAGSKCVFMGNVNYEPNFFEVTIQHGAEYKIISADDEYINCRLLKTA